MDHAHHQMDSWANGDYHIGLSYWLVFFSYPSEKYEFNSWDYHGLFFSIHGEKTYMFQTTNQKMFVKMCFS